MLAAPAAAQEPAGGRVGPELGITGNGRVLKPVGRQTSVGNFPTGAALTPDGGSYWVVVRRAQGTVVRRVAMVRRHGRFGAPGVRAQPVVQRDSPAAR